jgi:hypothetical protein
MATTPLRRLLCSVTAAVGAAALLTASSASSGSAVQAGSPLTRQADAAPSGPRAAATAGRPEPLFTPANGTVGGLPLGLAKYVMRRATTTVSTRAIASGAILHAEGHLLNLFPDVQIVAMRNRVESRSGADFIWLGYTLGDPYGSVILAVVGGKLGVAVTHKSGRYVVLPAADGRHEVLQIDDNRVPQADDTRPAFEQPPVVREGAPPTGRQPGTGTLDDAGVIRWFDRGFVQSNRSLGFYLAPQIPPEDLFHPVDNGSIIDVMVVYTRRAAAEAGSDLDLALQIILAIEEMNLVFQHSQVNFQLKLQPFMPWREPTFVETGDLDEDLIALRNMDSVNEQRDTFAADLVLFVTASDTIEGGEACGSGGPPFMVIDWKAVTTICFPHEMGHGLGLVHDWYSRIDVEGAESIPNNWATASDAHGHTQIPAGPGGMRTIMAYASWCNYLGIECSWARRWSNPGVLENGHPFGIWDGQPFPTNEVGALNRRRLWTANLKRSGCRASSNC